MRRHKRSFEYSGNFIKRLSRDLEILPVKPEHWKIVHYIRQLMVDNFSDQKIHVDESDMPFNHVPLNRVIIVNVIF